MVYEAYVDGVPTWKVDDLVMALGLDGLSKSEVSLSAPIVEVPQSARNKSSNHRPELPIAAAKSRGTELLTKADLVTMSTTGEAHCLPAGHPPCWGSPQDRRARLGFGGDTEGNGETRSGARQVGELRCP